VKKAGEGEVRKVTVLSHLSSQCSVCGTNLSDDMIDQEALMWCEPRSHFGTVQVVSTEF
jgi:hypothetical protein